MTTPTQKSAFGPSALVDSEGLLRRIGNDLELLAFLIRPFSQDSMQNVRAIKSAFAKRDFNRAKNLAHTLRGTASNLGGEVVANLSRALEKCALERNASRAEALIPELFTSVTRTCDELTAMVNAQ